MLSEKPVQLWLSSSLLFQPIKNGKIRMVNALRDVFLAFPPTFHRAQREALRVSCVWFGHCAPIFGFQTTKVFK